jgi:hypothetical protein
VLGYTRREGGVCDFTPPFIFFLPGLQKKEDVPRVEQFFLIGYTKKQKQQLEKYD